MLQYSQTNTLTWQETVLTYGIWHGTLSLMQEAKKITVQISEKLLRRAQQATGLGVTSTIKQGLELVAAGKTYEALRALRGKVSFSLDLKGLREDRR